MRNKHVDGWKELLPVLSGCTASGSHPDYVPAWPLQPWPRRPQAVPGGPGLQACWLAGENSTLRSVLNTPLGRGRLEIGWAALWPWLRPQVTGCPLPRETRAGHPRLIPDSRGPAPSPPIRERAPRLKDRTPAHEAVLLPEPRSRRAPEASARLPGCAWELPPAKQQLQAGWGWAEDTAAPGFPKLVLPGLPHPREVQLHVHPSAQNPEDSRQATPRQWPNFQNRSRAVPATRESGSGGSLNTKSRL